MGVPDVEEVAETASRLGAGARPRGREPRLRRFSCARRRIAAPAGVGARYRTTQGVDHACVGHFGPVPVPPNSGPPNLWAAYIWAPHLWAAYLWAAYLWTAYIWAV
jgi:hypothetical protein